MLNLSLECDSYIPALQLRLAELKQAYDKEYGHTLVRNAQEYSSLVQKSVRDFPWAQCKAKLVGEKKFAFGKAARDFNETVPSLDALVANFFSKGGASWFTTWWLIAKKVSIFASFRFLFITSSRIAIATQLTKNTLKRSSNWPERFNFGTSLGQPNAYSAQQYNLVFDLKERNLVWLNSNKSSSNFVPMARIELDRNGTVTHAHYEHESQDWTNLHYHSPPAGYDDAVLKLVQDYQDLLKAKVSGGAVDPTNRLAHLADGVVVPCRRPGGVPLLLPKIFRIDTKK